jgi:hypothetical protein
MTPVFERAKTVHALDRAATVIGSRLSLLKNKSRTAGWIFVKMYYFGILLCFADYIPILIEIKQK